MACIAKNNEFFLIKNCFKYKKLNNLHMLSNVYFINSPVKLFIKVIKSYYS